MKRYLFLILIISVVFFIGGEAMALELKSPAFNDNDFLPNKYTCLGEDISPPLEWLDAPQGTKSFALICDDPDAPRGTWVHWVIYDIPGEAGNLAQGIANKDVLSGGAKQGINDSGDIGYGGPCPPPGKPHRYIFKLYCLDSMFNLKPGLTKQELLAAIDGHVIEEAQITSLFQR